MAARDPAHSEVLRDNGELALLAIAGHRGIASASAAQVAFQDMLHSLDTPRLLVFLCPTARATEIITSGWSLPDDAGPVPYYFEFVKPEVAEAAGRTGVGFYAYRAVRHRL